MKPKKSKIWRKLTQQQLDRELIAETNELRALYNLPKIEIKQRNCLNCEKLFDSIGSGNRLCDRCKKVEANIFENEL